MIKIEVNNNKCKIHAPAKQFMQLQKAYKVRNPNAYFIRMKGMAQPKVSPFVDGQPGNIPAIQINLAPAGKQLPGNKIE